jgi:ABC-type siderophore export system fused ATPase/permease subunit
MALLTFDLAYVSLQRIQTFLKEEEVPEWASTYMSERKEGDAELKKVGFRDAVFEWNARKTDEAQPDVRFSLGPLDIDFPMGQLTLVTGSTGSGKSALLGSLLGGLPDRFYVPILHSS